jgi:hypothetical protein
MQLIFWQTKRAEGNPWRRQELCINGLVKEFQKYDNWVYLICFVFFVSGLASYFFEFILLFDDLIMLVILHVVDNRVYWQWGACDDSWILKSTNLILRKCSYLWCGRWPRPLITGHIWLLMNLEIYQLSISKVLSGIWRVFYHRSVRTCMYVSVYIYTVIHNKKWWSLNCYC